MNNLQRRSGIIVKVNKKLYKKLDRESQTQAKIEQIREKACFLDLKDHYKTKNKVFEEIRSQCCRKYRHYLVFKDMAKYYGNQEYLIGFLKKPYRLNNCGYPGLVLSLYYLRFLQMSSVPSSEMSENWARNRISNKKHKRNSPQEALIHLIGAEQAIEYFTFT